MTVKFYQIVVFEAALALLLGFILWQLFTRLSQGEPWIGRASDPMPRPARIKAKPSKKKSRKSESADEQPQTEPRPDAEAAAEPAASAPDDAEPAAPAARDGEPASPPQRRRGLLKVSELALIDAAMTDNHADGGADAPATRPAAADSSIYGDVEGRLERAFNMFETGTISIDGFERIVQAEREAATMRREAILQATHLAHEAGFQDRCADAEQALVAIKWCLDWAQDMRRKAA